MVELPEDSVVGMRFMTYAISCAIALSAMLFTGWLAYTDLSLRHRSTTRNSRIEEDHWDVVEIRRLQRFYEMESQEDRERLHGDEEPDPDLRVHLRAGPDPPGPDDGRLDRLERRAR